MRSAAFLPLAAMILAACNPADRQPQPPTQNEAAPKADAGAPLASEAPANVAVPAQEPAEPKTGAAPRGLYVAELRDNVPVINVLSRGRLEVVDDCLTVLVIGGRATAVFPPGVRRVMSGGRLTAVEYEGRRTPVGPMTAIPGGGVTPDEIRLRQPLPARCPEALWGLAG